MNKVLSSAGLLYVYLTGYEVDRRIYLRTSDTYHNIGAGLYKNIMQMVEENDAYYNIVHIFAVVGAKEKACIVCSVIEDELKLNFQRILNHKRIKSRTNKLDETGNVFFQCVQEFYCGQVNHFPKRIYREFDDITFCGIFCSNIQGSRYDSVAEALISLWIKRENPSLCGQQLMIKSFFMSDFIDRKVVAALPEVESGLWRLIFEGGHQLYINEAPYYNKETIHPNDLGGFCISNLYSTLMNPIYAYGKWFYPNDICEEWHKVFLYLCAVSETEWNTSNMREKYEKFLDFLERNICLTIEAPPYISKEDFCRSLIIHVDNFRRFLKGYDEPVISKDLHQTLNSRYVYLPYIWSLIESDISETVFSATKLQEMLNAALEETNTYQKGMLWENVAAYVLSNVRGWTITGRRIKAGSQEIDISIANVSLDNELWELGAYILVECKNWATNVDIHQIRNMAHISNMKGNKTAILFTANGISIDTQAEIQRLAVINFNIICITTDDLRQLKSTEDCKELIIRKWNSLQKSLELSTII